MIIRDKPRFRDLAFAVRGSILPQVAPALLAMVVIAGLMVWADRRFTLLPHSDATGFTVFGIALSLFLGFRNNAAYDRWWEARKLWGGLLGDLRSFAREAEVFVQDTVLRRRMLNHALAFIHLHRASLRRIADDAESARLAPEFVSSANPPCAALDAMSAELAAAVAAGTIDGFGARSLTGRLSGIAQQQAGCERIATTPLPYVYSLLIYRTTYLYCLLLPLALIDHTGWLTPLFVGIVAYVFLGLAEVSEELSHPFGSSLNALPLDAICRSVEISLAPHLGQVVPPPLMPQDYYLG